MLFTHSVGGFLFLILLDSLELAPTTIPRPCIDRSPFIIPEDEVLMI